MRRATRFVSRLAFVAIYATVSTANGQEQPQQAPSTEPMVNVWRIVPAGFTDPNFDQTRFSDLVTSSLSRKIEVVPKDTLSDLIKRTFNISKSWTPAVYESLLERIKKLNGIEDDASLKPGSVQVPDIAATAKSRPSANNELNGLPKISTLSASSASGAGSGELVGMPKVTDTGRVGSNQVLQIRQVPLSVAEALNNAATVNGPSPYNYKYGDVPMAVELGAEPVSSPWAGNPGCRSIDAGLASIIRQNPRRRAVVVVLDDAWPDNEEFLKARDFVVSASKAIRAQFKLDPQVAYAAATQDLDALQKRNTTSFPGISAYPQIQTHASAIKASLNDFTCNDAGGGVKVIYIPMTFAQDAALPLLREIMYLSYLARSRSTDLADKSTWIAPQKDQIDAARKLANDPFESRKIGASLTPFEAGKKGYLVTDQALVEQLAFFLHLYSEATQTPHFLSMSWVARKFSLKVYFPEYSYGLMLAAAGNAADINIHEKPVLFASRSTNPGDVIAVENSDEKEWLCSSSKFTQSTDVDVLGVGFAGNVPDSPLCGTSFSTPRVSWLLGAREAYVVNPPSTEAEYAMWQAKQKKRIRTLTSPTATKSARFHVTWQQLIGNP